MADAQHMPPIAETGKPAHTPYSPTPAERRRQQRTATGVLSGVFEVLDPRDAPPNVWAKMMFRDVRVAYWPDHLNNLSADRLRACAEVMRVLADQWDDAAGMMPPTD